MIEDQFPTATWVGSGGHATDCEDTENMFCACMDLLDHLIIQLLKDSK